MLIFIGKAIIVVLAAAAAASVVIVRCPIADMISMLKRKLFLKVIDGCIYGILLRYVLTSDLFDRIVVNILSHSFVSFLMNSSLAVWVICLRGSDALALILSLSFCFYMFIFPS